MFCQILCEKLQFWFPQFHVCLQSLLKRLAARWRVFDTFNNALVSCHCVLACHSSICHVLPNTWRKTSILQFPQFHVCLQSLLKRLAARWRVFDTFNNALVSCHCVLACHSSICHVLPNT